MELVALNALQERDLVRWRDLAEVALEPNPFFEPEYLLPLAHALGERNAVALAVVVEGDAWLAAMPVRRMDRWHRIPLPSMSMWRGIEALPALIGTPLLCSARAHDAAAVLIAGVTRSSRSCFSGLEWLVEGGPVYEAIGCAVAETGLRALRFAHEERGFLTRRHEGDYLERALKGKHRHTLRTQARKLARELGEELRIVEHAGEDAAAQQLIDLEGRSYLAERGTVLSSDPRHAAFFHEMCAGFAAQGRLQLLALQAGDRTISMKCNIIRDPGIFYFKIAYEERYARFSPGIQLEAAALMLFHDRPESRWIDSCAAGNNVTFNRLMPERRSLVTLAVVDPTLSALATVPALRAGRRMREWWIEAHFRRQRRRAAAATELSGVRDRASGGPSAPPTHGSADRSPADAAPRA